MNLIPIANKYFLYFSKKNIISLKSLFSKNINLRDWEVDISGYDNVIRQNIKIFKNLDNFKLKIISLSQSKNIIFAEIEIIINNDETIKVLDKIEFNKYLKIKKITAFKG